MRSEGPSSVGCLGKLNRIGELGNRRRAWPFPCVRRPPSETGASESHWRSRRRRRASPTAHQGTTAAGRGGRQGVDWPSNSKKLCRHSGTAKFAGYIDAIHQNQSQNGIKTPNIAGCFRRAQCGDGRSRTRASRRNGECTEFIDNRC